MKTSVVRKLSGFLLALGVVFFLSGCSRGSGDDDGSISSGTYFKFKANGVEKNYSHPVYTQARLHFVKSRNKNVSFDVTGYDNSKTPSTAGPALSIAIDAAIEDTDGVWKGIHIVPGTYTAAYNEGYILGCNHYVTGTDNFTVLNDNFVLTITELSKTRAKGVFSGVLEDHNGQQMVITDGEFSVGVQYTETNN